MAVLAGATPLTVNMVLNVGGPTTPISSSKPITALLAYEGKTA